MIRIRYNDCIECLVSTACKVIHVSVEACDAFVNVFAICTGTMVHDSGEKYDVATVTSQSVIHQLPVLESIMQQNAKGTISQG